MTQTISRTVNLGAANTGLALGYRVLNLDRTTFSAFTVTDVVESSVLGTYSIDNGFVAPDAGGYIIWGTVGTDRLEGDIAPASGGGGGGGNVIGAIEFTYTVTNSITSAPLEGVQVWIATDVAGTNVVWYGVTDTFGILRDGNGGKPRLDPGQYFFFRQKAGYTFSPEPDTETVS